MIKGTKILFLCGLTLGLLAFLGWMVTTAQAARPAPPLLQAQTEPSPRYGHTMVTISDTVYLFGGTDGITSTAGHTGAIGIGSTERQSGILPAQREQRGDRRRDEYRLPGD